MLVLFDDLFFYLSRADFADFGWMEAPMDLELFEQSLTPLLDDSLLVNPSTPEAYSHNQVEFL